MLTRKQRDLLLYIHGYLGEHGVPPSFEEMKEAMGLKSKSGIHRLINSLEERGFLERLPHKARALEVKKLPEGYTDNVVAAPFGGGGNDNVPLPSASNTVSLPLYGKIAAGTPIEALRDENEHVEVNAGMLGNGDYYALTIEGDSMIKAGIHDEDTVIIERCTNAPDGAIVVALVDGEEVTLKRIKRADGQVLLIPENDTYDIRILPPHRVEIQGRLHALIRHY